MGYTLFIFVVICTMQGTFGGSTHEMKENAKNDENIQDVIQGMRRISSVLSKQEIQIKELNAKIDDQSKMINSQQNYLMRQEKFISTFLNGENYDTEIQPQDMNKRDEWTTDSFSLYANSVYDCLYGILDLSCEGQGMILITQAVYGQYAETCNEECCTPDEANDCTETLVINNPEEWTNLRLACNYESVCGFQHRPHVITTCQEQRVADYLIIDYTCSEGAAPSTEPVAFTAYTTSTRGYYSGDLVTFEYTVTNIGNRYHVDNSSFVCPYDGLYMFSLNIMAGYSEYMAAHIMRNDEELVTADADDYNFYPQASNMVFADCSANQVVWVESDSGYSEMYSSTSRIVSTFSGCLMTRY